MTDADRRQMQAQILADEGCRLFPYHDRRGDLTIGYGRNLSAKGVSADEALTLFTHDLSDAESAVAHRWPWSQTLNPVRYAVLVNMAFNLGGAGLATFERLLEAVAVGAWDRASAEMLQSVWAQEVGTRAHRLARQMRTGMWT